MRGSGEFSTLNYRKMSSRKSIAKNCLYVLILVIGYGYLLYRLILFEHYPALWEHLRSAGGRTLIALTLCVALMPVNMRLEALKWQFSLRRIAPVSFRDALKQVYCGMFGAFMSPYRVADYPMRTMQFEDKRNGVQAMLIGYYGSVVLTLVIVLLGIPSAVLFFAGEGQSTLWQILLFSALVLLGVVLCPLLLRYADRHTSETSALHHRLQALRELRFSDYCVLFLLSFLRYLCFSTQLWVLLYAFGVVLTPAQTLQAIPLYYLLVTVTPNMPAIDVGIRGAWGMLVFGHFVPEAAAGSTLAIAAIWIINTILPVLIGGGRIVQHNLSHRS